MSACAGMLRGLKQYGFIFSLSALYTIVAAIGFKEGEDFSPHIY